MGDCGGNGTHQRIAIGCLLICLLICGRTIQAQNIPTAAVKKVSLHVTKAPLISTIAALMDQADVPYWIHPSATRRVTQWPDYATVTFSVKKTPWPIALERLLHGVFVCRREHGTYVILDPQSVPDLKVTLKLEGSDLESALKQVCDQVGIGYAFGLEGCTSQKITLTLEDVRLSDAIARLLKAAQSSPALDYEIKFGVLIIGLRENMNEYPPLYLLQEDPLLRTVTFSFSDESLWTALWTVCRTVCAGGFTIDEEYVSGTVTAAYQNIPLSKALPLLMRRFNAHHANNPLRIVTENAIVSIIPSHLPPPRW